MIKHKIEQNSYEWYQIRIGKVTSTSAKSVLSKGGKPDLVIDRMIAEEVSGMSDDDEDGYVSDDMQRGKDLEPVARKAYEQATGNKCEQVGFLQSERWPLLGVSSDSLIGETGASEIKCPGTKEHVRTIRMGNIPDKHFYQILCYFLVHEKLEWLDFVSYDPRFTPHPLYIKNILREDVAGDLTVATVKLDQFFRDYESMKTKIIFGSLTHAV